MYIKVTAINIILCLIFLFAFAPRRISFTPETKNQKKNKMTNTSNTKLIICLISI